MGFKTNYLDIKTITTAYQNFKTVVTTLQHFKTITTTNYYFKTMTIKYSITQYPIAKTLMNPRFQGIPLQFKPLGFKIQQPLKSLAPPLAYYWLK